MRKLTEKATMSRKNGNPNDAIRQLMKLPNVGKSIARDLYELGIRDPKDLVTKDPKALFEALQALRAQKIDRCVLYVFRAAVAFAKSGEPEGRKGWEWWKWSD